MTVIPLVVSLVITGVASTSQTGSIGRLGGRTLLVFFAMLTSATVIAIPLGIVAFWWLPHLVTVRPQLPPGTAEAAQSLAAGATSVGFSTWLISLIPTNPIAAAASRAMLPLILFTLLLALAISRSRSEEHTSELQSPDHLVCRLLLEKNTIIVDSSRQARTVLH